MKVEIEIPEGKEVKWVNGVLTHVDEKPQDITDRIKTFDDACNALGYKHPLVSQCDRVVAAFKYEAMAKDIIAFVKLRVICAALNEGWEPAFGADECRYYPWYYMFDKTEYKELYGDEEEECGVVCRFKNNSAASCDLVFVFPNCSRLDSNAGIGAHLSLKTRELAEYCGKQFIDIWKDFLFG